LDEIQTKVLRVFFLVFTVTSTAMPSDFCFFKITQPLTVSTVQHPVKEKGGKPDRNPHPLPYEIQIHTETSSLRTLKIMLRNLNEIVRS
jgi:hypothetical protein